jgi:hypothetical protein
MQDVDTGQYKHTDNHRQQSSGLKRQVVLYVATNVMEEPLLPSSENAVNKFLQNTGYHIWDYMISQLQRPQ